MSFKYSVSYMNGKLTLALVEKLLLFLVLSAMFGSPAWAESRLALLIGNKDYAPLVAALKNPINDIGIVGDALEKTGFKVARITNAKRTDILKNVSDFAERLSQAGDGAIGFFYYSGHGVSRPKDHTNYIIPVDIPDMENDDVWYEAVPLDSILREFERIAPNASLFVVFDACRNELRTSTKGGGEKGFEAVAQKNGMFIAFSTSPNESASDRGDKSGPYAKTLAEELTRPGQDNLTVFQNVKERVFSITQYAQRPWESNGLFSRVYFAGKPQENPVQSDEAAKAWEWVKFTTDAKILENFIARYGNTDFAILARKQLDAIKKAAAVDPPAPVNPKTPSSKLVLSILPNSPIYSAGEIIKIKITTASSHIKAFAVFPFGPVYQSKVEASYSMAEGGLYIPFKVPSGSKAGPYSIPVYVEEINSKLEEKHFIDIEIKG